MTYIRHRPRMVQESVFEDLKNTLIACRWLAGTTSRAVRNPANGHALEVVTVSPSQTFPLLGSNPLALIDYFPEVQATPDPNTFAMDSGRASDPEFMELGSNWMEQSYVFTMAFYAKSEAVATSVLSDLNDRYRGRIVNPDVVALYDYLTDPSTAAAMMEVDGFRWAQDVDQVGPSGLQLYFSELQVTDFVTGAI